LWSLFLADERMNWFKQNSSCISWGFYVEKISDGGVNEVQSSFFRFFFRRSRPRYRSKVEKVQFQPLPLCQNDFFQEPCWQTCRLSNLGRGMDLDDRENVQPRRLNFCLLKNSTLATRSCYEFYQSCHQRDVVH